MSAEAEAPECFSSALLAAAARADRESIDDLGTLLVRQIAALQLVGRLLSIDYRALHTNLDDGWLKLKLYTEGLYQQMHASVTTAAVLVGRTASPALAVDRLSGLQNSVEREHHPLQSSMRAKRREIDLLRWLLKVRNRAIQHAAEAGYVGGRAVVLPNAFALLHKPEPLDTKIQRKANDLLVGLHRKYGDENQKPVDSREAITYLDLFSHNLFTEAPAEFDSARRIVEEAGALDVVVSQPVLHNADVALATLIELAPPHPNRLRTDAR